MTTQRLHPRGTTWHRRDDDGFTLHIDSPGDSSLAFAASVVRGMSTRPRRLEPRFIYDANGSVIYEGITELPEYYQTRTEDAILASCADALAERVGRTHLVELGSGSSTKTRRLIEAFRKAHGNDWTYIPIDV
ncbi:MAG: L-histidine N(alpha)-methyltransferase, partial [Myxococcota bacterium]